MISFLPIAQMSYGEFFVFYIMLPWGLALVSFSALILIVAVGGPELRTIISAKLDGACQLVLGWVDGGTFKLMKYYPWEHGIMKNGNNFMQYTTPLPGLTFEPKKITFAEARKQVKPEVANDQQLQALVDKQNADWAVEAAKENIAMKQLNEDVKAKGTFCGRPLWLGHLSIGVSTTPQFMDRLTKVKNPHLKQPVRVDSLEPTEINIKDFLAVRFSPVTMFSILRAGEDYGRYGRPKGKFPVLIFVIVILAALFLVIGFLILSGRLDVSEWVKGMGLG